MGLLNTLQAAGEEAADPAARARVVAADVAAQDGRVEAGRRGAPPARAQVRRHQVQGASRRRPQNAV